MSFWETLKPSKPAPTPAELSLSDDRRRLSVAWSDGAKTEISAQALRQLCPCAGCVDEWTRQRTLDPTRVPETTEIKDVAAVGNYAVQFTFSDGHSTGIYDWPTLRDAAQRLSAPPAT